MSTVSTVPPFSTRTESMGALRIVFIGCVESSARLLRELVAVDAADVVGVVTRGESSFNADFHSLEPIAEENDIPCLLTDEHEADLAPWIEDLGPDVGYCFGWSHLLDPKILNIPRLGFVGFHPAALPQNRGRHPIIWALALGLEQTASTFFFMEEEADTGDILSQEDVRIRASDDAGDLYDRILDTAQAQVRTFTRELADGSHTRTPQDDTRANSWRKRSREDGKIDWRMPATGVYNLIRALAGPYPGAHMMVDGSEVKVWSARIVRESDSDIANIEPGKVLAVSGERVDVKCGIGVIGLLDHELPALPEPGDYFL